MAKKMVVEMWVAPLAVRLEQMVVVAEAECRAMRASVGQRIWSKVRDTCKRAKQQANLTGCPVKFDCFSSKYIPLTSGWDAAAAAQSVVECGDGDGGGQRNYR